MPPEWVLDTPRAVGDLLNGELLEWVNRYVNVRSLREAFIKHSLELPPHTNEFEVMAMIFGTEKHPFNCGWDAAYRGDTNKFPNNYPPAFKNIFDAGYERGSIMAYADFRARYGDVSYGRDHDCSDSTTDEP